MDCAAHQASLSITNSQSLLKLMSIESVMPSYHLIPVVPFTSCLQSFPASGSFPITQFFESGGQRIGASASASVLPMNIQDWFPLGLIFLQSKGDSQESSPAPQFKSINSSALSFLYGQQPRFFIFLVGWSFQPSRFSKKGSWPFFYDSICPWVTSWLGITSLLHTFHPSELLQSLSLLP